jgi:hypothetical protein
LKRILFRPTPKKARKTKAPPSGLVPSWRKTVGHGVSSTSKPTRCASESRVTTTVSHLPSSTVSTSTALSRRAASTTSFSRSDASTTVSIRRASSTAPTTHNEPEPSVGPDDDPAFMFGGLSSDEDEVGPKDMTSVNKYRVCYHFNFRTNVLTAHSPLLGWMKYTPVLYALRPTSGLRAQGLDVFELKILIFHLAPPTFSSVKSSHSHLRQSVFLALGNALATRTYSLCGTWSSARKVTTPLPTAITRGIFLWS